MPEPLYSKALIEAFDHLLEVLNGSDANYALIGALGVAVRGVPRSTQDIDFMVEAPQVKLPAIFESLRERGFDLQMPEAIRVWNSQHLLTFSRGEADVDWLAPVVPVFKSVLQRADWNKFHDRPVCVADAEGLIILKLISFRGRDQEDIRSMLSANRGRLDLDLIRTEWSRVSEPDSPTTRQFEQMVAEYYDGPEA